MTQPALHIATFNIHKGFSQFNRRMMVHELRERLRDLNPDIAFLQEVQGLHLGHAENHDNWPGEPQHEFLAEDVWPDCAYGRNMIYDHGHHGNAILSRFPILHSHNQDVTHLQFEKRGLLHCRIELPSGPAAHCVCVHLSLFGYSRQRQLTALADYLDKRCEPNAPLIIAGDFNDWRNRAGDHLAQRLELTEIFSNSKGTPARSFPAALPMFRLDRIYVRGFNVVRTEVHHGHPWSSISDHAALSASLTRHAD
ncbi:endonuclease/exonuclease/phosphatase family protein [Quatrionicoccus australiensis]|uniref:endonuclease/exonuclease/phosphatase family protein n=1 Tax=Quatrionicoccus australiensis TaxID=138118 RepID=UPI001CF90558|nr:endonuclease/exonuclease/phosphatase family protein [Quatrionicoccus australiensis]UCV15530.1 endonuclease/exonuclease/phosphatase family protein [Quatrionicoccus australiensis]